MSEPNSLEPLGDLLQYTSFASDIDLTKASPACRAARWIKVEDVSGGTTLKLEFEDNPGVTRTLTVTAGWERRAKIRKIIATTNVSRVTVGF